MMAEGHREAARSVIDRAEHGGMRAGRSGRRDAEPGTKKTVASGLAMTGAGGRHAYCTMVIALRFFAQASGVESGSVGRSLP